MQQNILLIGGTGMLGQRIAYHLLNQTGARVRLMVRTTSEGTERSAISALRERDVTVVEGDLTDLQSLDRATRAIDVIVCAVAGGHDVIVDGQLALAEAGKRNGVRRIIPSDFTLDFFKVTRGEHAAFDARLRVAEAIEAIGIESVHVLQGIFMDTLGPGSSMLDHENAVACYWGDGTELFEVTSVDDTARMTAKVALDEALVTGKFAFAGDRVSMQQAVELAEAHTGRTFVRHSLGTESALRKELAVAELSGSSSASSLARQLYMINGQARLSELRSRRYASIELESLADFFAHRLKFFPSQ